MAARSQDSSTAASSNVRNSVTVTFPQVYIARWTFRNNLYYIRFDILFLKSTVAAIKDYGKYIGWISSLLSGFRSKEINWIIVSS